MSQLDLFHVQTPTLDAVTREAGAQLRQRGIKLKSGLCRQMGAISHRIAWARDIQRYPQPRPAGPGACWGIYCSSNPRLAMTASVHHEYRTGT